MRNSVTFGIVFIPKSSKAKNGKAPLYARITLNGERIELSLQRRITLNLWDERKSRLKGCSVESLHDKTSLIITTNKSPKEWAEVLKDDVLTTALLDRILHRCEIIKLTGKSYRMEHRKTIFDNNEK